MPIINVFGGIIPKQSEHNLPDTAATVAHNVKLHNGRIEAWRERAVIEQTTAGALAFHVWGCCYLHWAACVRATEYLPDYDRLYLTGRKDYPEVATSVACVPEYLRLGVPAPTRALVAVGVESCGETVDHRSYVYTYVNRFGEESAPSPATVSLSVTDRGSITLSGFDTPPADYGVIAINLYRTATGFRMGTEQEQELITDYLHVIMLDAGTRTYVDTFSIRNLGPALTTRENRPPPDDLRHISHVTGTGCLVGVTNNQVHFSEDYEPANWPARYVKTFTANIVNMVTLDNIVFITTDSNPYIVNGAYNSENPMSRAYQDIDTPLPDIGCGYANSMTVTPFGAVYASLDGLVLLKQDATFDIITANWFSSEEWRKLQPETVRLAYWRGYLICVTDMVSFMLEIDGTTYASYQLGALTTISDNPVDMQVTENGELLMLEDDTIYHWDAGGTYREYLWESTKLTFGGEGSPSVAQIKTSQTIFEILDSESRIFFWQEVFNDKPFRLPRFGRPAKFRVGFRGVGTVEQIKLAMMFATLEQGV